MCHGKLWHMSMADATWHMLWHDKAIVCHGICQIPWHAKACHGIIPWHIWAYAMACERISFAVEGGWALCLPLGPCCTIGPLLGLTLGPLLGPSLGLLLGPSIGPLLGSDLLLGPSFGLGLRPSWALSYRAKRGMLGAKRWGT